MNRDKKHFTFWWFFILLNFGVFVFSLLFVCLNIEIEQIKKNFNTYPIAISTTMLLMVALANAVILTAKYLVVPVKKNEPNLPAIWVVIVLVFAANVFASASWMGSIPVGHGG